VETAQTDSTIKGLSALKLKATTRFSWPSRVIGKLSIRYYSNLTNDIILQWSYYLKMGLNKKRLITQAIFQMHLRGSVPNPTLP
jgi:hypothetical protein